MAPPVPSPQLGTPAQRFHLYRTHYTLRKIDYPYTWHLLKSEGITHFNAAPTVNTLLCADSNAVKLPSPVRVTVAASPPSAKLFKSMIELNLFPVHVYGLVSFFPPFLSTFTILGRKFLVPLSFSGPGNTRYRPKRTVLSQRVTSFPNGITSRRLKCMPKWLVKATASLLPVVCG